MGFLDRFRGPKHVDSAADGDMLILTHLRKAGADLAFPRHVLHYSYFPDEGRARAAADAISAAGYSCRVGDPLPGYDEWSLVAETTTLVDETTVATTRAWFDTIAAEHEGQYDGWEAAAQP